MDLIKTKKFRITQSHFDRAVKKFKDPKHQEWIKTYFPFKPADIELPPKDTITFNARNWAESIWDEYINLCNTVAEKPSLAPWRTGFYKFFGGIDFKFIDLIEAILLEEGAFPNSGDVKEKEITKSKSPSEEGWVYLIRNRDLHKIGITKALYRRMRELKADETIFAIQCPDFRGLEKKLHSMYDAERIHGSEFFRLNDKQVEDVQKLMNKNASI